MDTPDPQEVAQRMVLKYGRNEAADWASQYGLNSAFGKDRACEEFWRSVRNLILHPPTTQEKP